MGKHTLYKGGVVGPETRKLIGRLASVANKVGRLMSKIDAQWESGVGTRLASCCCWLPLAAFLLVAQEGARRCTSASEEL